MYLFKFVFILIYFKCIYKNQLTNPIFKEIILKAARSSLGTGNVSGMLSRRSHRSPVPPRLCVGAGKWAEPWRSGRRPVVLSSLWGRCVRGARGHRSSHSALYRLQCGHCKRFVHHRHSVPAPGGARGHGTRAQRQEERRAHQVSAVHRQNHTTSSLIESEVLQIK